MELIQFYEKIISENYNGTDCNKRCESMAKDDCNLFIKNNRVKNTYKQENTITK